MKKRLFSLFLAFILLAAIPLSARYRYNPFTRKMDYYAMNIALTGAGEVAGDVLYYDGTNWVNLPIGAATEVLAVSVAGIPDWVAAGAPGAHAASHEVAGADLVDHDNLTNFVGNEHLLVGAIDHDSLLNYVFRQHVDIDNVFYVAAVGGEYATITAALNAENAAGNIFLIGPGTYAGDQIDFTANNQTVIGMGDINDVHVTQADGIVIDFGAFDGCSVTNIYVEVTAATTAAADVITGTGSLWLYDVYVQLTNLNVVLADQPACIDTTGIIRMHRGLIEYANGVDDGGGVTAIKAAIRIGVGADVLLDHVRFDVTGANQSLALTSSYATGGVLSFYKCYIDVDDDASSNTIGVVYSNMAGTHEMYMNDIHVDNATLLAHGVFLINTDTMRSMFNHIHVTSAGGSAYGLNAEAGTTIISQFDDIVATTPTNGAGTFTVVNSPEDGNFFVSGTVIIAGATASIGDADTAGSVIISDGSNHTQTISTGALDADITFVLPVDDGDNLDFLQTNGGGTLAWVAGAADTFTLKVDVGAVADYFGVDGTDGLFRFTANHFTMADGGNFVTLSLADHATARTALGLQIGTDVQALNAVLTELTALADPGADEFPFWNDTTNNFEFSTVLFPTATGINVGAAGNVGKLELEDADGDALGISVGVQAGDTDYIWPTAFPGVTGYALTSTNAGTMGWDSDITDLVTAATTGTAGKVELTQTAEVSAGVDTTRAVTADALAGSTIGRKSMVWKLTANDEVIVDQDDYDSILVPADFAGWLITGIAARIVTADDGADFIDVGIYNVTQTAEILSTLMRIEAGEWSTLTSAQPGVIDVGEDDITAADVIRIDVDYGGDNCTGLEVHITFERVT